MIKEGVAETLDYFIQGYAPATVGSAHYLNKVLQAKMNIERLRVIFVFEFVAINAAP